MLAPEHRLVLLQHQGLKSPNGKTGKALLRYGNNPIVAVIDEECAGGDLKALTGIPLEGPPIPIVASVEEALAYSPDVLAIGIAPSGGLLPEPWWQEVKQAVSRGLSVVNGLHTFMSEAPDLPALSEGQWIWDVRREPKGLGVGRAKAAELSCLRVLCVGMDMAVGKMSTSLELHAECLRRGMDSKFLATGQTGLMLMHDGVPLDSIRLDFAAGSIEGMCLAHGRHEILHIEGQGSVFNPASTAPLSLLRGCQPTHLLLVHRAGEVHVERYPHLRFPPLTEAVKLYEALATACGTYAAPRVVAIALNTGHMEPEAARRAVEETQQRTGLPCSDPIRFGPGVLLDAVLAERT